jgi:nitrogen regulatory protein P-II 1
MKLIVAIIRPEKLADVKRALFEVGVTGMTLSRVSGHGGERDVVQQYRGESVVLEFHSHEEREQVVRTLVGQKPHLRPLDEQLPEMTEKCFRWRSSGFKARESV